MPQPLIHLAQGYYLSRSLALPTLSLAVPFVWSERPSDFLASSPVTAPVASLALPLALSRAPSPLSWLLLFPLPAWFSLLRSPRAIYVYLYEIRLERLRLELGDALPPLTLYPYPCVGERPTGN